MSKTEQHTQSLALRNYSAARQTCQILQEEYVEWKKKTMDATISEVSGHLPPIPPEKYLKQHATLSGHSSKIVDIAFSPDSNKIFSVCQDGFGIIWDVLSGLKLQAIPLEHRWTLTCSYSPSGRLVALAGLENKCSVYSLNTELDQNFTPNRESIELTRTVKGFGTQHKAYIGVLEFLTERELITGSGDSLIRLWDVEKRQRVREYTEHSDDILCALVAARDLNTPWLFYSSSADGTVRLWDTRQERSVHNFHITTQDVNALAQLPDGNSFVTGDELGHCQLFDLRSLCAIESYDIRDQFVNRNNCAARTYSLDSQDGDQKYMVPSAPASPLSSSGLSNQYDIAGVTSIAVSKSGRIMYTCYADYGCISWDVFQKKIIEKIGTGYSAHQDRISQVKVSEDGQGLATASWDTTVRIWTA